VDDPASTFEPHRARLIGIAYRMLGSRADAEDTVQDAYLRWHRTPSEEIRSVEAWLVTTVTRLAIDRLRAAQAERAHYVGPWLPEPFVGEAFAPPADVSIELTSTLSLAFLAVLERLAPEERAAFLLHDVFDSEYAEIAEILGKSEEACRQIVSRARKRVREDRPRVQVTEAARKGVIERFVNALLTQNKTELMNLLAVDVGWTSDGGGKAKAARKVLHGNETVTDFIIGVIGRYAPRVELRFITVNGELGLALYGDGHLTSVISFVTDGERILDVYSVLNPEKLQGMQQWGRLVR
jgi:RNA polymerase sigma-70 factor (ECF subfamily)